MVDTPTDDKTGVPRRGRPRMRRIMACGPFRCYAPQCDLGDEIERIILLPEEIETLRLVDLEGLEQEEAANTLGISRRTLWKDLHEARKKVTDALVNGKLIEFSGCPKKGEAICPHHIESYCQKQTPEFCPRKYLCPKQEEKG